MTRLPSKQLIPEIKITRMELKPIINKVEEDILTTLGRFQLDKNVQVGDAKVILTKNKYNGFQLKSELYPAVEVRRVDARGLGLFALENIKCDTVIGEYVGEIVTQAEMSIRADYSYALKYGSCYIDSRFRGNYTRFVNSSHMPNAVFEIVNVNREKRVVLIALTEIAKGHEITADYGRFYGGKCYCGKENCTGEIGISK